MVEAGRLRGDGWFDTHGCYLFVTAGFEPLYYHTFQNVEWFDIVKCKTPFYWQCQDGSVVEAGRSHGDGWFDPHGCYIFVAAGFEPLYLCTFQNV